MNIELREQGAQLPKNAIKEAWLMKRSISISQTVLDPNVTSHLEVLLARNLVVYWHLIKNLEKF